MRGAKVEVKCQRCRQPFMARVADRKRGWGKFCSKSCKAAVQEARTGQYSRLRSALSDEVGFSMTPAELSLGGYGDADWDTPFHDGKF